ncbi:hypothetical protein BH23ACI1_BH23ACI1_22630 [soil metagenome]
MPAAWAHLLRREGLDPLVLAPDIVERALITGLSRVVTLRAAAEPGAVRKHEVDL